MAPPAPDPAPSVVLEAREGFLNYMEANKPTPEELFDYLVTHDYVTLKAFLEWASRYEM